MELLGRRFGHIVVTEVVGQGGMGDVYAGYDEKLERKVALKVLNADQRLDDEARERLLREARALSKLEHPNICRIHDYIEQQDVDLLVLEYIDGRTLHDALRTPMTRREKLAIAIAIAQVLVEAHRAGIVHRDLKPENVMLTKTGEVKVLDFGLARWLNRARARSSDRMRAVVTTNEPKLPVRPREVDHVADTLALPQPPESSTPPRRDFLATAVGITLGTPLYMSPEQARGETLTPASDMFSFGLLLQVLFTGQEPHPDNLSAREVILRVARGETVPATGGPRDVVSLINRLKQFAPTDRPTAIETMERLRFLDEKPQRVARRSIVAALALIAVLGAWRYTVDLRAERAVALEARGEAERRRAQAEDLINFMVGDLRNRLEPVGRLDVLDAAGERVLKYIEAFSPSLMSADELARTSKALNQLGEVRIAQGKLHEALAMFQKSLQFAQEAARRDPQSGEARLAVGTAHFWIGDVYRRQADLDRALQHYTAYMNVADALAAREPSNDKYQLERAYGHSSVASIFERRGDLAAALEHLQLTRKIKGDRVAVAPDDPARKADLANTLNRIGWVLERSFDLRGARDHYEQELATYAALMAAEPRNARWKERLGTTHNFMAYVLELMGDVPGALEHRRAEVGVTRELHHFDRENVTWQRNFAVALLNHGNVLRHSGDTQAALREIDEAERLLRDLLTRKETLWSWRRDLAVVLSAAARADLATGNAREAMRHATEAVAILESLEPDRVQANLAAAQLTLGDAAAAGGDPARAREAWSKASALLASLPPREQTPQVVDTAATALVRLGRRDDAASLIARLQRAGYRAPDFMRATAGN
ncbi:MAG TPA: serine/threonine-protein kinase [Thermoanaerobaculia bacterium]|nr:serine/threonine-protein kinase [Thermoanaerobaculia bacterium]